jgi:uncharacterized protein YprB with RNaseH-like and TPR domain
MALDIETDTSDNGLAWRRTRVVSVAVYRSHTEHQLFDNPRERVLLDELARWLAGQPVATVETWNGVKFDLPMLWNRSAACQSKLQSYLASGIDSPASWFGHHRHRDLMLEWKGWANRTIGTCRLKAVAEYFHLSPIYLDMSGRTANSLEDIRRYNLSDARVTWELGRIWDRDHPGGQDSEAIPNL